MTASTFTVNLDSSFEQICAELEAAKKAHDKVKLRRDLIQQILLEMFGVGKKRFPDMHMLF